ncbi:hypothetical protein SOVF_176560 isoform A [Spinacia oleracea]|uniref:Methyltransferase n=1 Tax=Spinacia oleracea TaxID=3562 RepID=A0A9R0K0L7_SPIOL|nr:probable methyltransferase PMT19 [Spinacia oleracea]KNA06928.1 hypothetical protein SOVF_176560 isoform A [Spinacia oleracea]
MAFQIQLISKLSPIIQKPILKIILLLLLFSLSYLFGSFSTTTTTTITTAATSTATCTTHLKQDKAEHSVSRNLDFTTHHSSEVLPLPIIHHQPIKICPQNFTNYCPCQDLTRPKLFSTDRYFHRERHCPQYDYEKLRCCVPKPPGYRPPFRWPKSRDTAWFSNVPSKKLAVSKKKQNWVRLEGDRFIFPGGGTSFPKGVKGYVDLIKQLLPLKSGRIRTALDVGCGVASLGAALWDYNIVTMSIAPLDVHEAQVQFALERGLPAMLGILSTYRLPYPSRSFELAHCSRCLVQWADYDGLYLLEVDRVLRPGGYWILSGPPIGWRVSYKAWQRSTEDLKKEQMALEDLARRMCWKKIAEKGPIAVWQKPTNHVHCARNLKTWNSLHFCKDSEPDFAWYRKMEPCITPLPDVKSIKHTAGGTLEKWPKRLNVVPPRVSSSRIKAITSQTFNEDNRLWRRRIQHYGGVLISLFNGGYRNIMDMNAGLGGFAAALSPYPLWVMNVVPFDSKNNTLGVIYERGLIGSYINWCEAFSTYPRTYDLIHADGVFSMYMNKCDVLEILMEMYRILRPHGAVIVRDNVDILVKVKDLMKDMGWEGKLSHSQRGPLDPEKVLFVDNTNNINI